ERRYILLHEDHPGPGREPPAAREAARGGARHDADRLDRGRAAGSAGTPAARSGVVQAQLANAPRARSARRRSGRPRLAVRRDGGAPVIAVDTNILVYA